jgi:hypothetical protein
VLATLSIVSNIMDRKEEERAVIVHMLWSWWNARNKANAGEQMPAPDCLTSHKRRRSRSKKKWQPPPDVLKINNDGEWEWCLGFQRSVVRDSDGQGVLAARVRKSPSCLAALAAAMERTISHTIIETDATNLVSVAIKHFWSSSRRRCIQSSWFFCTTFLYPMCTCTYSFWFS